MEGVKFVTQTEYENLCLSFREKQKSKPRYHTKMVYDENMDWRHSYFIPNKMTSSWNKLQDEYDSWEQKKVKKDTFYMVYEK